MAEEGQNYKLFKGNTKEIDIVITGYEDLVGVSVKWSMSWSAKQTKLITKTSALGQITISGLTLTIKILPADTVDLKPGRYYHEAEITDSQGNVSTVSIGRIRLVPKIN